MEINKLEQLRKSICDIEIERIRFKLFSNQKEKLLELVKLFRSNQIKSKVYYVGINHSYDSLIERNHKKRYVAAILKRFKDHRSNV